MPRARRSWSEKLADSKDLPRVEKIDCNKTKKWGTGTFVIPAPREVDELMQQVPLGRVTTIDALRSALARKHSATIACPLTTGIFAWIAAHAGAEAEAAGTKKPTPWWRTLKAGGEINPKYPGGPEETARRLRAEGHRIVQKGKRWLVADYDSVLWSPQ